MTTKTVSARKLARDYGYDQKTVLAWITRGMPNDTEENARNWIIENILRPLRETDLNEQIQRERLRKLQAEADLAETEVRIKNGELLEASTVERELSQYFKTMRDYLRTLPNRVHHEIHEQADALAVKRILLQRIDEILNEIGTMTMEGTFTDEHIDSTETNSTKPDPTDKI